PGGENPGGGNDGGDDTPTAPAEKFTLSDDKMTLTSWNSTGDTTDDMTADPELAKVKKIGDNAFAKVEGLTSITLPEGLTEIGTMAFANTKLTSIQFPSKLTTIGVSAFLTSGLTAVTIPDSVTEIKQSAFNGNSISTVEIGTGIQKIGHSAFIGNPLRNVTVNALTPPALEENAFGRARSMRNLSIFVPAEKVEEYKAAERWKTYASKIKAKTK
ncbi:MAG: leucine-rich repeat domain-containing protein, partial [Flavobacteriaceae bacterium]|nr:leucine-rich repeat domain-containing protein [Flavobacteriaceae bacterium]